MARIDPNTHDYVLATLSNSLGQFAVDAVTLRLYTQRGSYWANPLLGSRLHLIAKGKDVPRNVNLAKQYIQEAMSDLLKAQRINNLVINVVRSKGSLNITLDFRDAMGAQLKVNHVLKVGG